ncbi:nitroreductase [Candidatus Bathyarchaeota archaeon]|nr:MAG: nitroreductase [Candidatus Bathyarchaeota archaeon]
MDVFEAIKTRRSIREYQEKPVEQEKLSKVLEAARLSPSAANKQPWKFIVVTDPKVKESLRSAYNKDWLISAPVIIVGCALPKEAWVRSDGEEYWKVDLAIAMQSLILEAWEQGLGTCWIGAFREDGVKKALGIPDDVRVVALTPLGYPAEEKGPVVRRKPLEEIVSYDHW